MYSFNSIQPRQSPSSLAKSQSCNEWSSWNRIKFWWVLVKQHSIFWDKLRQRSATRMFRPKKLCMSWIDKKINCSPRERANGWNCWLSCGLGKRIPSVQWAVWGVGWVTGLPVHDQVEGWCVPSRVNRTAACSLPLLTESEKRARPRGGTRCHLESWKTNRLVLRIGRSTKGKQVECSLVCRSNTAQQGGQAWISSNELSGRQFDQVEQCAILHQTRCKFGLLADSAGFRVATSHHVHNTVWEILLSSLVFRDKFSSGDFPTHNEQDPRRGSWSNLSHGWRTNPWHYHGGTRSASWWSDGKNPTKRHDVE